MKTLAFAAAALLSISAGTAFAESGDGWDMPYATPAAPTTLISKAPTADRAVTSHDRATFVYGSTSNYVASPEDMATPQPVAPVTPRDDMAGYPVTWGSG